MVQIVVTVEQVLTLFVCTARAYEVDDQGHRDLIAWRSDTVHSPAESTLHDPFASALRSMATWAEQLIGTPTDDLSWGH